MFSDFIFDYLYVYMLLLRNVVLVVQPSNIKDYYFKMLYKKWFNQDFKQLRSYCKLQKLQNRR